MMTVFNKSQRNKFKRQRKVEGCEPQITGLYQASTRNDERKIPFNKSELLIHGFTSIYP